MDQKVRPCKDQPIFNNLYMSMVCAKHAATGRAFKQTKAKPPRSHLFNYWARKLGLGPVYWLQSHLYQPQCGPGPDHNQPCWVVY